MCYFIVLIFGVFIFLVVLVKIEEMICIVGLGWLVVGIIGVVIVWVCYLYYVGIGVF